MTIRLGFLKKTPEFFVQLCESTVNIFLWLLLLL